MRSDANTQGTNTTERAIMSLVDVNLPPPSAMRGGWAALAAVLAARGWEKMYTQSLTNGFITMVAATGHLSASSSAIRFASWATTTSIPRPTFGKQQSTSKRKKPTS
ncbi:hypothetical protein CEN49_10855 [Fischerella thermalis CCMEE 5273]|nr:hypothetical protein CBP17_22215 [Fischerella thermalis WC114]PLZ05480.1 hypothetical protein CBP19_21905 [Fischerella thermalis WC1110]PLZ05682.1 hypothetical protein CBP18_20785 [Fischerella thermalis WC119]PLZ16433.1 hypothetical protein CBP30_22340 [Fischerella thermalis WC157]PLZ34869.1 hypothetical protein CBP10_04750 [Fischerella thermalis WC558]PLZ42111.1 hypothetical protein CBP25_15475 [Fischerella thermalis WC527]PLZ53948.1 hypothetical protein CBP15_11075 [Fischerella thermalis